MDEFILKVDDGKIAKFLLATQGVGIVFIGIFLAAYLAGLPTTAVLHSDPAVKLALAVFGSAFLILSFLTTAFAIFLGGKVSHEKFVLHVKIGLLIVALTYFLFTLHATFTLSWIGEWERMGGFFSFIIFVEDISATFGLVFRFAASGITLALIIFLIWQKDLSTLLVYKFLRVILVFEGLYWFGLIATAGFSIQFLLLRNESILSIVNSLFTSVIPTVLEAVVLPITLFISAYKLSSNKPVKAAVRWGLIAGTIAIAVFWLINTSIWMSVLSEKGAGYLTAYPEHLSSFISTVVGLALLTIYMACFTKMSSGSENGRAIKLRSVGGIVLALGLYFLWNYLSWILFAGNTWNNWYAWFLGHNMDLWMLSLPLLGLPLLFHNKSAQI